MKRIYLILALQTLIFNCCKVIDQPEAIPSFISINNIDLKINNSQEGTASHSITDAWVYVDGNLEGVYELPAEKIPLHYQGEHELKIYAGIKRNGISADRKKYDFYTPYTIQLNLIQDSIIELLPEVEYENDIFIWLEDFEDPQPKFERANLSDTNIYIINSPSTELFEGNCGAISMTPTNYLCEIRTNELDFNDFPTNLNIPAYMEMNYKCNHEFVVGILHKGNGIPTYLSQPLITLVPTTDENGIDQWNKTYLYLPDATNFYPSATDFDIYIAVLNSNSSDDIEIRLDNIKVIFRN